ncbi:MAG: UvrD-helicase domain-containing protein [Acetobacter sp.]|nr:UvrD-helicase domain-containing protein [Acetobacter sp.]
MNTHLTADYLTSLNPEQRLAVETTEGPLLVLAGAGTGKTRVLTTRFAHILLTNRAKPWQILAVTFTNKAAQEMHKRIENMIDMSMSNLWLGTFHALCTRMLRRHANYVGLTPNFTILDTDDQIRLLKQVIEPWKIDIKRWPLAGLLGEIQRWKDRGLTPQHITPTEDTNFADGHARAIYEAYQTRLLQLNACDFGDLMLHVTEILRLNPDILAQYHTLFRYILVDEYQDTNTIQYLWLRLLAQRQQEQTNICCVGDDDQSIYAWRGAEVKNILRFEKDFPNANIVRLERNYRSTSHILGAATKLVAHNNERLSKTLCSGLVDSDTSIGEKVAVIHVYDSDIEAEFICQQITLFQKQGYSLAEMAILVRAGFQTRSFEEYLVQRGLPYRIIGGTRFYERAEIRDVLAYFRVLIQPADDLAFERIVNVPKRGIGATTLQKIRTTARTINAPLMTTIQHMLDNGTLNKRIGEPLRDLLKLLSDTRDILRDKGHIIGAEHLLEASHYLDMWRQDRSAEAEGRIDNIMELLHAMEEFTDIESFLEHVALVTEKDTPDQEEYLSIMTLHRAKGLEFDIVFLPGWEDGLFPSQHALNRGETKALEEERRLAYVGITRARKQVMIFHANRRRIYTHWQNSIPSRFLKELPEKHVTYRNLNNCLNIQHIQQNDNSDQTSNQTVLIKPSSQFQLGDYVCHNRFGTGVILSIDREHIEVAFETIGTKRIVSSYIKKL